MSIHVSQGKNPPAGKPIQYLHLPASCCRRPQKSRCGPAGRTSNLEHCQQHALHGRQAGVRQLAADASQPGPQRGPQPALPTWQTSASCSLSSTASSMRVVPYSSWARL